jgi:hypothetical protein
MANFQTIFKQLGQMVRKRDQIEFLGDQKFNYRQKLEINGSKVAQITLQMGYQGSLLSSSVGKFQTMPHMLQTMDHKLQTLRYNFATSRGKFKRLTGEFQTLHGTF